MGVLVRGVVVFVAALAAFGAARAEGVPVCAGRDLSADPTVKPHYEAFSDDLLNSDGLLWKIEKAGVAPSHLYGTIHSTQAEPVAMAREAAQALDESKSVATELGGPFDAEAKVNMSSALVNAALSPGVDTFAGQLTDDETKLVERFLATHGYAPELARHLKLWFLALASSLPSCEAEGEAQGLPEVDDTIARLGAAKGLKVVGLETIDEQVAALVSISPTLAVRMLVATARSPSLDDDAYVTLLKLYLQKRPAAAIAIIDAAPGVTEEDRAAERDFTKQLLVTRNAVMVERAQPLVDQGGAFIAVGALHLSGKDGLIERYRRAGYSVTKVW